MSAARLRRVLARGLAALLAAAVSAGCGVHHPLLHGNQCRLTTKPPVRKQSVAWHLFDVTVLSQLAQDFDVLRMARRATGHPKPAVNLIHGAVADSSFFVNRDVAKLSLEQIRRGPTQPGWEPKPPYLVTRAKGEGKTSGFFVQDRKGDRYLFKLDHPSSPELITGAEAVTSKLMHALGYYVPSYEIVNVPQDELVLAPESGITREAIQALIDERGGGTALRVCASRLLEGERLGPFSFKRYRHFAELRALKLPYAWTNNTDAKDHNTLMVWTGREAVGYLIDFGTSLGGDADRGPQPPCRGWLNDVDIQNFTLEVITFGMHDSGCDPRETAWSPAVGIFSPKLDAVGWKAYAPNLAFEELTPAEAQWMANRMAQFSRPQIEAAVSAGRYRRPEDAARIVEVLEARRATIVAAYLKPQPVATVQPDAAPDAMAPGVRARPVLEVGPRIGR